MTRETAKRAAAPRRTAASKKPASTPPTVAAALAALKGASTRKDFANLARFGIAAPRAYGVSIANVQKLAKRYGRDHEFAAALWEAGWYEARLLAAYVDDPALVTPAQMERWCRDFDNWGICDTVCFVLFDRSPHAWPKVEAWSDAPRRVREAGGVRAPRQPRRTRQAGDRSRSSSADWRWSRPPPRTIATSSRRA